jgi:D-amino-acid oxidase
MRSRAEALVVGAGVSGVTTALVLASHGYRVRIWTRDRTLNTTSRAAGAIWGLYLITDGRTGGWAATSWREFERYAALGPDTGVRFVPGVEAARRPVPAPAWLTGLPGFRPADPAELPAGFATGWAYTAPIIDMPTYLHHLVEQLVDAGGRIEERVVGSLDEALAAAPLVVNCTGYGARQLVPDPSVVANRGQIVVVEKPGIERFFVEHDESPESVCVFPQGGDRVVLGGTAEPGRVCTEPEPRTSAAIRDRCAAIVPELADAKIVDERVGLRPTRPRVRLESTTVHGRRLVHNYGHGGGGVTLSWGCAREVLSLIAG